MQDPYEKSVRALLNYGHTFAHALETVTGYGTALPTSNSQLPTSNFPSLQHGEAVALGMIAAARLAASLGKLPPETVAAITALIARAGLPTHFPNLNVDQTHAAMATDKKVSAGQLRFILPTSIGSAEITTNIPHDLIHEAITSIAHVST